MSELFDNIPQTENPSASLRLARDEYEAALLAYKDADTDETGELAKAMFNARNKLELAERSALAAARGITPRTIEQ